MKYIIPDVLDKSDIEWLTRLISNSVDRAQDPSNGVLFDVHEHIVHWDQALTGLEPYKDGSEPVAEKIVKPRKPRAKTKKRRKIVETDPFKCPQHKNYHGHRATTTDCDTCWDIYKTINGPHQYELARRRFAAKQKLKELR